MDSCKTWIAFLVTVIIERCVVHLKKDCPGCQNGVLSPLLHYHTHFTLLDTIKKYMQTIVNEMDMQSLYNSFLIKFGYFETTEEEFVKLGQSLVRFSTPDAIYYGNYITKENDHALYAEPTYEIQNYEPTPAKEKKSRKRSAPKTD